MANSYSNIQVGLDWERKGFICWGASPSDAPNLVPTFTETSITSTYNATGKFKTVLDGKHDPTPVYYELTLDNSVYSEVSFFNTAPTRIPLTANTTHTFSVYFEPEIDFEPYGIVLAMNIYSGGVLYTNAYSAVTPPVGGGWYRGEYDTTGGGDSAGLTLEFASRASPATSKVKIKAFMVTATSIANAPEHYNTGSNASRWDDITRYVMRADTSLGYSERFNLMPDEGTATIVVNNEGRNFTPKHITGVLPGDSFGSPILDIGKTIQIRGASLTGMQTLFTGTIREVEVLAGRYRDRAVTITCEQGIKAMERHEGDIGIVPGRTIVEHIEQVFAGSGAYFIWSIPFLRVDDDNFPLDYGVLYSPDLVLKSNGTGAVTANPGVNIEWPQTLADTIRNALDFDGGMFFVDGAGFCGFYSRDYLDTASISSSWPYEDFSEDAYIYDSNLANAITLDYKSRPLNVNPTLIQLGKNTITMPVSTDMDITIEYDYEGGGTGDYSYGNHISQTLLIKKHSDGTVIGSGVGISFISELDMSGRTDNSANLGWGTQVSFMLYNYTGFEIDVEVTVNGIGTKEDGAEVTEYLEDASILAYGRQAKSYSNPFITDNTFAAAYVEQKMAQLAYPSQYFKTLALTVGPDTAQYLETALGDVIELVYEFQTHTNNLPLIVVGKSISWQPQQFRLEFTLGPVI